MSILLRKLSWNEKKTYQWVWTCPNFVEKTFTSGSQTAKFVKVFSLESSRYTVFRKHDHS